MALPMKDLTEYVILLAGRVAHAPLSQPSEQEIELYKKLNGGGDAVAS